MARSLVIVESPAKAKTISRFLGDGFEVAASVGHVADLPSKGLAVDVDNGFKPTYELTTRGKEVVKELRAALQGRRRALPRHRRGPRGRSDLVAPARGAQADGAGEADGLPRDHPLRDRRGGPQPTRHRLRPGRRGRDPAHPRPALRLRGVAGPVEEGQRGAVGRPRAEPRDPARRRARAGAHPLRRRRATGTSRRRSRPIPAFAGHARRVDGRRVATGRDFDEHGRAKRDDVHVVDETLGPRPRADGSSAATSAVRSVDEKPYRSTPEAAVHDLDPPAGGRAQAQHERAAGDARRAGPVRAAATSPTCAPTRRRCPRPRSSAARSQVTDLFGAQYLADKPRALGGKGQERAGGPRGDPSGRRDVPHSRPSSTGELRGADLRLYELIWKRTLACQMADATGQTVTVRIGATSSSGRGRGVLGERHDDHVPRLPARLRRGQRRSRRRARGPRATAARARRGAARARRRARAEGPHHDAAGRATPRRRSSSGSRSSASAGRRRTRRSCRRSRTAATCGRRARRSSRRGPRSRS